jgi:hypothetical protein
MAGVNCFFIVTYWEYFEAHIADSKLEAAGFVLS